jgi:hypothetical protein
MCNVLEYMFFSGLVRGLLTDKTNGQEEDIKILLDLLGA